MRVNCTILPEIVVTPNATNLILQLCETGNLEEIAEAFTNNADLEVITSELNDDHVLKLRSGNYYIGVNYESQDILTINAGLSFPVTAENSEFTFEYVK